jgi:hypothetical protein
MAEFNLKVYRIFEKYRNKLKSDVKAIPTGEGAGIGQNTKKVRAKGARSKNRILDFFLANGRWPDRVTDSKRERQLGTRFENFIAKTSPSYDPTLRRIARALGRGTNNKRPHNVVGFKEEIMVFVKEHGRVPTTKAGEKIAGEGTLRNKLDYYTKQGNDMTLLGMVYKEDPCHRSGIPMRFRPYINQQLDVTKPLIRLVK